MWHTAEEEEEQDNTFFLSNIGDEDIYDEYHDSSDEANDDMIVTTPCNSRLFSIS